MDGLFHKITEWCIKYGAIKTTEKTFNLPNNPFDKLTSCEHNNGKHLIFFVCGSIFFKTCLLLSKYLFMFHKGNFLILPCLGDFEKCI